MTQGGWLDFFERDHSIYVSARHLERHYVALFDALAKLLPNGKTFSILDYGCGDALMAPGIVAAGGELWLYDAAREVRRRLGERYAGQRSMTVVDEAGLAALPDGSFDIILVVSVIQYLSPEQLEAMLVLFRRLLKADGSLIVADVLQPGGNPVADARSLLSFAHANGFLGAALWGLVKTLLSDYSRLRSQVGLAAFTPRDFIDRLARSGWKAVQLERNISPSPHRNSFVARKS